MWLGVAVVGILGLEQGPRVNVPDSRARSGITSAVLGALLRLDRPECQKVLTDFQDVDGRPLLEAGSVAVAPGEGVAVVGPTGSGHTTLFRALAGRWPFGGGHIAMPPREQTLFLSQRPYLPIGVLRDVVSYPMPAGGVDDAALREMLEAVGLIELGVHLDEPAHWALRLSPGEQQRIAVARALVQKPEWLFLDEATSAVDEAAEARLYRLLRERLSETTLFSIGHRPTLHAFHARRLVVQLAGSGPASVVELPAAADLESEHRAPRRGEGAPR